MKRLVIAGAMVGVLMFGAPGGEVTATAVTAQQRYPWNGMVDITVTFSGASNDAAQAVCRFMATNSATHAALNVSHVTDDSVVSGSGNIWRRRFVWNVMADLGEVKIADVALTVEAKSVLGGVQLWENGPYWAECNVGATKPEEYGYYFWWGDTIGYSANTNNAIWTREDYFGEWEGGQWEGVKWVSSTGAWTSDSPFFTCPTYDKTISQLQSDKYIDSTGNLVAAHDAATVHLGAPWRMPTDSECIALVNECDWAWTARNGVYGLLATGRNAFSSKSIFLPATGYGYDFNLKDPGLYGYYWSSTPNSDNSSWACFICFLSSVTIGWNHYGERSIGRPVRPLREFAQSSMATIHLAIDCRMTHESAVSVPYAWIGEQFPDLTDEPIVYETKAKETAMNGFKVWECFVAGLSATDPEDVLRMFIKFSNGQICLTWTPDLNSNGVTRIYKVSGRTDLDKGDWETPVQQWHRFFKVEVAMPTGAFGEKSAISGEGFVPEEKPLGGVQLWENGPYWAECNVGATKPEECGYYFWWGDTVGYVHDGSKWVASDGSLSDFNFYNHDNENPVIATIWKNETTLKREGWIGEDGNLSAKHDAATVHLGAPWRMPTDADFSDLIDKCDTLWTTYNGVWGRLFTGRDAYSSKSIFLPAVSLVAETFPPGSNSNSSGGCYWSSTPCSGYIVGDGAWELEFSLSYIYHQGYNPRYWGLPVRPLRGVAK